jgi:membrane fusion protein, multidrug efflux system
MERIRYPVKELILGISLILCIIFYLGGCRREETHAARLPEKTPVIVKRVTQLSTNDIVFVSGSLEADKTAPLSFLVPGRVDRVYVEEGDHVKRGQLLASVESDDYRSNLEIAEAALLRAMDAYTRYQPLYKEGVFAEKNFIELKTVLAQAKAGRNIVRKKLKDTKLRTPIPGIVGAKNIEVGQMISPEIPVFTIVKTDTIFARVSVPESEIGKIVLGLKAEVTVPAIAGGAVNGNVSLTGVIADPQTRTFTVKIELPNPGFILRTGMIVQAKIITDKKIDILTLPGKAIVRDADDLAYVFTADAQGIRALRRRVFPGAVYKNEIEIKKGLEPGDAVIVGGQHKLTDGASISIVDSGKQEKG